MCTCMRKLGLRVCVCMHTCVNVGVVAVVVVVSGRGCGCGYDYLYKSVYLRIVAWLWVCEEIAGGKVGVSGCLGICG